MGGGWRFPTLASLEKGGFPFFFYNLNDKLGGTNLESTIDFSFPSNKKKTQGQSLWYGMDGLASWIEIPAHGLGWERNVRA